jgi:secreted PhoX family phosphatase
MHSHDDSISDNPSGNPHFNDILDLASPNRRRLITATMGATLATAFQLRPAFAHSGTSKLTVPVAPAPKIKMGFKSVNPHFADTLSVPPGYTAKPFFRWGDAISTKSAPFKLDASNTAAEQALQAGMHTDGMHFFPLPVGKEKFSSSRGILCVNHEYTDDGLLHTTGFDDWSAEKVAKCQAAMGISVVEIEKVKGEWRTNLKSRYNRRINANTVCDVRGPARGDARMNSKTDATGRSAKGTMSNCAHGLTPWGTYLTCEENFPAMFTTNPIFINPSQARYGLTPTGANYRWSEFDQRFDAGTNPNEFNHFGWVVEIDPFEPNSRPVKRTALGRFRHESATMSVAPDNRVVIYSGDDAAFEYIYKFVTAKAYNPTNRAANKHLLDEGTLYVARFNADGSGVWLPLVHGQNGLTAANGFNSQADVVIFARRAGDQVGATKMDRPEWIAVHPTTREVYCSLTNNSARGAKDQPGIDAANRRANNIMGSILRWREANQDPTSTTFEWDVFIEAGDSLATEPTHKGNINGDAFGCPDGLWIDPNGLMWIQTDASTRVISSEPWIGLGNNQMLACDVSTGEVRRFLVGPTNCEITGMIMTPDCRTLFVGIQHPGETPSERSNPKEPRRFSNWPDYNPAGRPRSAVVVISKNDGGVIGT